MSKNGQSEINYNHYEKNLIKFIICNNNVSFLR